MRTIAIFKLVDFMCDNKSTLVALDADGFVDYHLYSGHATSGIPEFITNLDRDGLLPNEFVAGESDQDFAKRVEKSLIKNRLCKQVSKVILKSRGA